MSEPVLVDRSESLAGKLEDLKPAMKELVEVFKEFGSESVNRSPRHQHRQ